MSNKLSGLVVNVFGRIRAALYEWPVTFIGVDPDGNPRAVAVDANGKIKTTGGGGGTPTSYVNKTADFTATAKVPYSVDTASGAVTATLPASPTAGDYIEFVDATNSWGTNKITINPNGKKIGGQTGATYSNNQIGGWFFAVFQNNTQGWQIYATGGIPVNTAVPTIDSNHAVGVQTAGNHGTWTGAPSSYLYQWQSTSDNGATFTNIVLNANTINYTPVAEDVGNKLRLQVQAVNSNGDSVAVSSALSSVIIAPTFPSGAVAYWKLDETSGTRADATGNGNSLTDLNSVLYGTGIINNGALFAGSGGQKLQAGGQLVAAGSDITVAGWMKTDNKTIVQRLFDDGGIYGIQFGLSGFNTNGNIDVALNGGGGPAWYSSGVLAPADGTLFFMAVTVDSSFNVVLYAGKGGTLYNTTFNIGSNNGSWLTGNPAVGSDCRSGDGSGDMHGLIDEVGVWNRALTSGEITTLYGGGTPPPYA